MSKYPRIKNDAYFSEPWTIEELIKAWYIPQTIWECAAGDLNMANALREQGRKVYASDIKTYSKKLDGKHNFLKMKKLPMEGIRGIVTNPPYAKGQPELFIRKALWFMENHDVKTIAMLLKTEYSHNSKNRRDLFDKHFACKFELTRRIRWIPNTKTTPRELHSWFIWHKDHAQQPVYKLQTAQPSAESEGKTL